jgi:hypothetical protein
MFEVFAEDLFAGIRVFREHEEDQQWLAGTQSPAV